MTAEFIAQRRDDLRAERFRLTRAEARLQRQRDHRGWYVEVDRFLHRPATLTGVRDPAFDVAKLRVLLERTRGKLVQPGADNAPVLPDLRDLRQVELREDLRRVQDLITLGICLL